MILYLTYNDTHSGIYSSQVIDVVKFLRKELHKEIRLVSLISLRNFLLNRRKIKDELPDAIVVPMVPGISRWAYNHISLWILCLFLQPKIIIGRSVLATHLALKNKKKGLKIIYDGRGAIAAEWEEYKVVEDKILLSQIKQLEKEAILSTDYRIAVSHKLVEFWKMEYGYSAFTHAVIPCTLNKLFEDVNLSSGAILKARTELGLLEDDIVFVYSGSVAGWQSFALLYNFLAPILNSESLVKILFLTDKDENITKLEHEFPGRIICKKVAPDNVPDYLLAADYGLLIREKSITNKVASPVKFAEYLACGLPVVISEELGDYTDFVVEKNCGFLMDNLKFEKVRIENKNTIRISHLTNFLKTSYLENYKAVVS